MSQLLNNERGSVSGAGLGLRSQHTDYVLREKPKLPWFELLIDNYFASGGLPKHQLEKIAELYPLTFHSVGLSIGSSDPLDFDYLRSIKKLMKEYKPAWTSEHLCWTSVHGRHFHDLLPLPYTEETIKHVSERISQVQDFLGMQILIENVSSYLSYKHSEMTEAGFVAAVADEADCAILLDANNIYVSAVNHNFPVAEYLDETPLERVVEIHLGGHEDCGEYLLDAHNSAVSDPVWELYEQLIARCGPRPTLVEWDNDLPEFPVLEQQAIQAQAILDAYATEPKRASASV